MFIAFMLRIFNEDIDYYVPAEEVERTEKEHHARLARAGSDARYETNDGNLGVQA